MGLPVGKAKTMMTRKTWGVLITLCGATSVALADDHVPSKRIRQAVPESQPITIDVRRLGWDVYQPFWNPEVADLTVESYDFDDKSALERITKLRSLSLVTFAETNNTRLFLGVNKEGMVGLHFSAFPRYGKDRHLSLWSMPYVSKPEQELLRDSESGVRLLGGANSTTTPEKATSKQE